MGRVTDGMACREPPCRGILKDRENKEKPEPETSAAQECRRQKTVMNQHLELAQKQILSQHLIQSMEILQMSTQELESYLENLSMENPVIEIESPAAEESGARETMLARKLEWLESTDYQNKVYYREDSADSDSYWQDIRDEGEVLSDYLIAQLPSVKLSDRERQIVEFLIYSLDSNGYFRDDLGHVAETFSVSEDRAEQMLEIVQSLDPAGVGARNLSECLLLQLHRLQEYSPVTEAVIRDHLDDVGRNHLTGIARKLKITMEEVQAACREIRSLNPKPGNAFSDRNRMQYISPDAVVVKVEDGFEILINEYQYPKFHISSYYQEMEKTVKDAEAKKYLREKIQQAQTVESSIQQRTSTLSRVLHVIVERQQDFFLRGAGNRKPLKLADIAQATGLHESTVSRTLRSKYLQCTWGVYPLNYFLTSVASTNQASGEEQTPEYIKKQIREIIDGEDRKKPLSDEAISKALTERQICISRRTVNKYRQEMGIPDKSGRKNW